MKKCSIAFFVIILVQFFAFSFNYNDFLIDMGLRRKCGYEKIGIENKFLAEIYAMKLNSPHNSIIDNIKINLLQSPKVREEGGMEKYLTSKGFHCKMNIDLNCSLQERYYTIQSRLCHTDKYKSLLVYRHEVTIVVSIPKNNPDNMKIDYEISNSKL